MTWESNITELIKFEYITATCTNDIEYGIPDN